jgi:hypothetical protein
MTILAILEVQRAIMLLAFFWYLTNSRQGYKYKHSGETCMFQGFFEDGSSELFQNVGTYTPIYMASDFRKPKSSHFQYTG